MEEERGGAQEGHWLQKQAVQVMRSCIRWTKNIITLSLQWVVHRISFCFGFQGIALAQYGVWTGGGSRVMWGAAVRGDRSVDMGRGSWVWGEGDGFRSGQAGLLLPEKMAEPLSRRPSRSNHAVSNGTIPFFFTAEG